MCIRDRFDTILAVGLGILAAVLLLGKGEKVLKLLNGGRMVENKKRTEEEKLRYSRAMGVFVGVLALAELILALFPNNNLVLMINIGIVVVDLVAIGTFTKKYT